MNCSRCGAENSAERSACWRCGTAFSPTVEATPPARGIRLRVIVPICIVTGLFLLLAAYARWHSRPSSDEAETQATAAAESDQKRTDKALAEATLVNARANDLLRAGKTDAALKLVDEILAVVDVPDLQETKIYALVKAERHHEAYELLQGFLQKRDAPHLHFLAGQLAQITKGPAAAVLHFAEAIRQSPENKVYQLAWATACFKANLRDSAIAGFNKLITDDPKCAECWSAYAQAYYSSGDRNQAVKIFAQAVNRVPENPTYQFGLARVLDRYGTETGDQQKLFEAAEHYRKSLELNPRKDSLAAARYYEITRTRVPPELENIAVDEVELEGRGGAMFIRVLVNGVVARFVLDTGASFTAIQQSALERFRIQPTSQKVPMQTANGIIRSPVAYADLQISRHTLPHSVIIVIPDNLGNNVDGLFGLDSLRRINGHIDPRSSRLVIQSDQTESVAGP